MRDEEGGRTDRGGRGGSGAEFRWYAEEDGLATHGTLVTVGSAALGLHAEAGATELMSTSHHHLVGITKGFHADRALVGFDRLLIQALAKCICLGFERELQLPVVGFRHLIHTLFSHLGALGLFNRRNGSGLMVRTGRLLTTSLKTTSHIHLVSQHQIQFNDRGSRITEWWSWTSVCLRKHAVSG